MTPSLEALTPNTIATMSETALEHIAPHEEAHALIEVPALAGVLVKPEYRHPTGSFKWRGAFNAALQYKEEGAEQLVVATRGNHGIGAAMAGKKLELPVNVVIPYDASSTKKQAIKRFGATVMPHQGAWSDVVVYGKVIAAQVTGCDVYARTLQEGTPLGLVNVNTGFEGVAVDQSHPKILTLMKQLVDEMVVVERDEVHEANLTYFEATKDLLEPAGGVAIAAAKRIAAREGSDARVIAFATGAHPPAEYLRFLQARVRRLQQNSDLLERSRSIMLK